MNNKGQTLIELLITIGLSAILIPALLVGFSATRNGRAQQEQRLQATSYLSQAQEAIRIIVANNWDNLANGTYHPVVSGSTWILAAGSEAISGLGFIRQIIIGDVYRDNNGNIVISGGALDPSTKHITISVSWTNPIAASVTTDSYLTRHKNLSYLETAVADFTPGISNPGTTGVTITNTSGGEIVLGAGGGGGDWCQPSQSITSVDLSRQGVPTSVWAFEVGDGTGNRVFAGTGQNASGPTFTNTKVIGNNPPTTTPPAQYNNTKANGVFGIGNYAYIATDQNSAEVTILDLTQFTDPPTNENYKKVGAFDTPGPTDANSVFVLGNTGYVITGSTLYNFNVTDKTNPTALDADGVVLAGTGNKVIVIGNYAYVVTSSISQQLQIIDVSSSNNLRIVGNLSSGLNDKGAVDIFVNSSATRAYIVTSVSSNKEFFIIDITNKTSPTPVSGGVYEAEGMDPKGVAVVTGNKAIIAGTGGSLQYQVIDISDENSPKACGPGLAVAGGVNAISSLLQTDGYAYSYIVTGDTHAELKIILGGAGAGSNYASSGVFESATFDAGKEVAWNTLLATVSAPLNTTLQFKVALKPAVNNSCSNVSFGNSDFVGSDGQSSSYFPFAGGVLPFDNNGTGYENPAQCERYRAYLSTTDPTQTPVIYDVALSYSP